MCTDIEKYQGDAREILNAKLAKQNGIANEGTAEHLATLTGAVTVPVAADIARIAKELKVIQLQFLIEF